MAREYGKVGPTFWTGDTGRALRQYSSDVRLAALYLVTCGSANMIGLYYLPVALMAHELGWPFEGASKALLDLAQVGFCEVDEARDLIWVREMVRYQVGEALKRDDKRVAHIEAQLTAHAASPLAAAFRRKYHAAFQLQPPPTDAARSDEAPYQAPYQAPSEGPSEGGSKGLPMPLPKGLQRDFEAPPKPESREQRTDQDTHSAGAREGPPPGRVVPFAADGPSRNCGHYSPNRAFHVPAPLHAQFLGQLVNAGASVDAANEQLFEWYRATEAEWTDRQVVVGDNDFDFWRARWRETHGTTARPVAAQGHAPHPGAWRPTSADIWGRVLVRLEAQFNRHTFLTWFRDTALLRDGGDTLEVVVPDTHVGEWIHRHYADQVTAALRDVGREGVVLVFVPAADSDVAAQAVHA